MTRTSEPSLFASVVLNKIENNKNYYSVFKIFEVICRKEVEFLGQILQN